jgi:co-chaperonin GroES (HSP10)
MKKKVSYMTGPNVLVEILTTEEVTDGGIVLPGKKEEGALARGVVKNKGPGFLIPFPKDHTDDLSTLIGEGKSSPTYLPLDVEIGDTVYFPEGSTERVMLDGRQYHVIPYPAIKVFERDEGQ